MCRFLCCTPRISPTAVKPHDLRDLELRSDMTAKMSGGNVLESTLPKFLLALVINSKDPTRVTGVTPTFM